MNDSNNSEQICGWCNQPTTVIWVHGHGQCIICGYNIDECCRGENCETGEGKKNDTISSCQS